MPSIAYGTSAYRRENGNFPELKLINMFVESAATSEQQVALISRPGLGLLVTNGVGPINGLFSKKGTLNGDVFSISNATLYRGTSAIAGTITGTGATSFAGGYGQLTITRGATLHNYNGTNLASAGFTGNTVNTVTACTFIGSLFVAIEVNSARFFWSAPLNGRSWNVLNFATAEREPDSLLDIAALGDNIWLFGQQTVECWADTGSADLPFTRLENVAFDKGIMSTGCVTAADNSLFFVGSNRSVYRVSDVPEKISDNSIDERILASATARVFSFMFEGHEFVCVRLADETLAYDCSTKEWCEFQTSQGQWQVAYAAMVDKIAYLGHELSGQIMGWDEWDDLGEEMERRFTAAAPLNRPVEFDVLRLWANAGATTVLDGQGSDPVVEMRYSRDAGRTWSVWLSAKLGAAGQGRMVATWRRLGTFDFPGAMFEFRVADPVPFRVSAVKVNDPSGERSRV
jgi:hypothetical protein